MRDKRNPQEWFIHGRELRLDDLPAIDFQMHTRWSDGASTVAEMISAARVQQLEAIAITEHVNPSSAWYPHFVEQVKTDRAAVDDLAVYYGAEVAAADYHGGLKADPASLERELLLGVVHRLPKRDGTGFWDFNELTRDDAIDLEIWALVGLAGNPDVDVLGHPGATTSTKYGQFPVEWLEPVYAAAREHGTAIELNSKYAWDLDATVALLNRIDPLVSFGSDAHDAAAVGPRFGSGSARRKQEGAASLR
ncbi:MAG: PHP domain-containing protein [Verrucomicrobiota bacterium]|nr:PHP domain-containing protein [Verrucomicrobiota bacterium]